MKCTQSDVMIVCWSDDEPSKSCQHAFCVSCVQQYFTDSQRHCPVCGSDEQQQQHGAATQPDDGVMMVTYDNAFRLPGYETTSRGTIVVSYSFPPGVQKATKSYSTLLKKLMKLFCLLYLVICLTSQIMPVCCCPPVLLITKQKCVIVVFRIISQILDASTMASQTRHFFHCHRKGQALLICSRERLTTNSCLLWYQLLMANLRTSSVMGFTTKQTSMVGHRSKN